MQLTMASRSNTLTSSIREHIRRALDLYANASLIADQVKPRVGRKPARLRKTRTVRQIAPID